jgi:cysteine sulfinate desulfinase/cysteine desulfurase-like protein
MDGTSFIIYRGNNSTTPVNPIVFSEIIPFLKKDFLIGTQYFGQRINEVIVQARDQIADFINALSNELTFTSGALEGKFNSPDDRDIVIQKLKELIQPNFKYA